MDLSKGILADAAAVQGGKLYVHGGGWDQIFAPTLPWTHPSLAIAFVLRVEYLEAMTDLPLRIEVVDQDERVLDLAKVEGTIRVGHPPVLKPGSPIFVPHAITYNGLQFAAYGSYKFRITSGEKPLTEIPFSVMSHPMHAQQS